MDSIHERIHLKSTAFSNIITSNDRKKIYPLYLTGYGFYNFLLAKDNFIQTDNTGKINFNTFFKDSEFVSGIFDPNIVLKQQKDTLLSIITNPVTRVYEMYFFAKIARENKTHRPIIIDPEIYKYFYSYDINEMTLEQYIDKFIEYDGNINKGNIAVCHNLFRQYNLTSDLNFVCTTSSKSLKRGFKFINDLFKIDLNITECQYMLPRSNTCSYRIKEIEKILAYDIEIYKTVDSIN
jgi:hypothetical protein